MSARTFFHLHKKFFYINFSTRLTSLTCFGILFFTKVIFDPFRLSALSQFFIFKTEPCA